MKSIVVIVFMTMLGVGLTSQMRPIQVESDPIVSFSKKQVAKEIKVSLASPAVVIDTFKTAPVVIAPAPVQSAPTGVEQIVRAAARKYGLGEDHFMQVARCESGLNPGSVNHGYYAGGGNPSGLFQFLPETWSRMSSQSGVGGNVFDATSNANVAAWAWANGHSGEWECR